MKNTKAFVLLLTLILSLSLNNQSYITSAKTLYQGNDDTAQSVKEYKEVRASHILVDTKEEAEQIREQIINGKDFAEMAKKYSKCPSSEQGGDLGYFSKGMMVPEFEKVAFESPVGAVSEPVKTQFGWHLILVTAKR
jgi:peptidyl-prolyl cis-trans isomerase C